MSNLREKGVCCTCIVKLFLNFFNSRPPPAATSSRRAPSSPTPSRNNPPPRNRPSTRPTYPDRNEINSTVQNAQNAYAAYNIASSLGVTPSIPNRPDMSSTPSIPK